MVDSPAPEKNDRGSLKLADNGEQILFECRPNAVVLAGHLFVSLLIVAACLLAFIFVPSLPLIIGLILVAMILAAILYYLFRYLDWRMYAFQVTPKRMILKQGLFAKKSAEVPLERLGEIEVNVSFIERLLKVGSVRISSMGDDSVILLRFQDEPVKIRNMINFTAEQRKNPGDGRAKSGVAPYSPVDEITKLFDAFERGALSYQEYQSIKAALIRRIIE
ncbi:MAG: PH domain-containing protein [Actinomycetota bacterium]|nr:PH domain-containing protein [Actinomycetota bacterium]